MNRFLSTRTHAIMGIIVGLVLLFAPNIFGFADNGGAAVAVPRILGIIFIMSELLTDNGIGAKIIPMSAHLVMDIAAGAFLAVSPWLFGFHNQGANAWLPHLLVGLLYIGTSLVTRTSPDTSSGRRHAAAA